MEGATGTQDHTGSLGSEGRGGGRLARRAQSVTVVTEAPLLLTGRRVAGVGGRLTGAVQFAAGPGPQDQVGAGQRGAAFKLEGRSGSGGVRTPQGETLCNWRRCIAARTQTSPAFLPSSRYTPVTSLYFWPSSAFFTSSWGNPIVPISSDHRTHSC